MSPEVSATRYLLALSALRGVGPAALRLVLANSGFLNESLEAVARRVPKLGKALDELGAWEAAQAFADQQMSAAKSAGARILTVLDDDYPLLLKDTPDAPFFLFVVGNLYERPLQSVAIIGTRNPTEHGKQIAKRITCYFAEQQWSVVSGLALGCDAIAHRAALDAKGHTVAVLAHGLQMVAPSSHRKLAEEILESGGALISEYPFGVKAIPAQFVKRDRTQAGLAQGVVMVQSDLLGGSLHASRAALEYKRWLGVPYPTERDRAFCEPKIEANLVLSSEDEIAKAKLMRCNREWLRGIRVLRSKDDYPGLLSTSETSVPTDMALGKIQGPLF